MPEPRIVAGVYQTSFLGKLTSRSSTNFYLPPCPADFQEKPMPTPVSPRILIVDDEAEITEILADLLSEDYDCSRAGSAEDALARLRAEEFQLVISDITM